MDSSYRDIEVVEDDMGEGYMDPIEEKETFEERLRRDFWKVTQRTSKNIFQYQQKNGWSRR